MEILILGVEVLYLIVVLGLSLYGLNSLIATILFLFRKNTKHKKITQFGKWPRVTVQIPIYNEKYTVTRSLQAVTKLDYPSDRIQIQVLDDSTDDTAELVTELVREHKNKGINIERLHRINRTGYKAGALEEGLHKATGEFIAIFDADFSPSTDWLKKTIPFFQNPVLGCLQTRWGHVNRKYNTLTQAEAMAIDGHFIIEQSVRASNGFFLNFNGTAGLWRRECIEDAGGWQWDTLTEDLDLSYRAQMRGWKIEYVPEVVVPAELPMQVEAFKEQQFRWAKGSFQVARKILPKLLTQPGLPWNVRLMAIFHLTGYFVNPLMLAALILTLPVGLLIPQAFRIFPFTIITAIGPPLLYATAAASRTSRLSERLKILPLLTIVGFGISLSTSIAVLQGLTKKGGTFVRTPKLNLGNRRRQNKKIDRKYLPPISPLIWAEVALGIYALITVFTLEHSVGWGLVPWMVIYTLGYFYVAGLNLIQHVQRGDEKINKAVGSAD